MAVTRSKRSGDLAAADISDSSLPLPQDITSIIECMIEGASAASTPLTPLTSFAEVPRGRALHGVVVGLLPDLGHVIPLLRIARSMEEQGVATFSYVGAEEGIALAADVGLHAVSIGGVRPSDAHAVLERYGRSGRVMRALWLSRWFYNSYVSPMQCSVVAHLDEVVAHIRAENPDFILADPEHFDWALRWIADLVGVPLVLHSAAGNHFVSRDNRKLSEGRAVDRLLDRVLPSVARISDRFVWRFMLLTRPARTREWIERERLLDADVATRALTTKSYIDTTSILTGIAPLEARHIREKLSPIDPGISVFGSLPPLASGALDVALETWLSAPNAAPVVYIGFGTMASAHSPLLDTLIRAATEEGFRVLVAGAHAAGRESEGGKVLHVPWLAQSVVLAHPAVQLFITHAGAGAIQEGLWNAKPMICIPFMFDQHYNAWSAEELGIAVKLERNAVTVRRTRIAIREARGLARISQVRSDELRAEEGAEKLTKFVAARISSTFLRNAS